jgi:hypothetical protein
MVKVKGLLRNHNQLNWLDLPLIAPTLEQTSGHG